MKHFVTRRSSTFSFALGLQLMCGVVYLTKILLFSLAADILTFSPQLFCAHSRFCTELTAPRVTTTFPLVFASVWRFKSFKRLFFSSSVIWIFHPSMAIAAYLQEVTESNVGVETSKEKMGEKKNTQVSERVLTAESERWECIDDAITDSSCAPVYIFLCFSASHFHFRFDYYCKTASVFARCARSLPLAERKRKI